MDTLRAIERHFGAKTTAAEMYEGAAQTDPYIWHCLYRRLKGVPATFNQLKHLRKGGFDKEVILRHRPFLIQPLRDPAKIKVYIKGRQVGVSEIMVSEEIWFLMTHPNKKWMHTFHRKETAEDFSNTRIKEALNETERIRALVRPPDQVTLKRIGSGYLFIRSASGGGMGEGTDIDGLTLDERDRMPEGVEDSFREGLESSLYGLIRYVSTPSIPGKGVSLYWEMSDKKHWFVRCSRCNKPQPIKYPDNYIQVKDVPRGTMFAEEGTWKFLCKDSKCRGELDRVEGEWVAEYPSIKEISGYHIPQAVFMNHTATSIMNKRAKAAHISLWENYVLGLASSSSTIMITEEDFLSNESAYEFPLRRRSEFWEDVAVGIDWGGDNWATVTARNRFTGYRYVIALFCIPDTQVPLESARNIANAILPLQPDVVIADGGFGKDRNPLLREVFGDKFWVCNYGTHSVKKQRSVDTSWNKTTRVLTIDRTLALKTMCSHVQLGRVGVPRTGDLEYLRLKDHCLNLRPQVHEEKGEIWETIEKKGPDHYAHALTYSLLGAEWLAGESTFDFTFVPISGYA